MFKLQPPELLRSGQVAGIFVSSLKHQALCFSKVSLKRRLNFSRLHKLQKQSLPRSTGGLSQVGWAAQPWSSPSSQCQLPYQSSIAGNLRFMLIHQPKLTTLKLDLQLTGLLLILPCPHHVSLFFKNVEKATLKWWSSSFVFQKKPGSKEKYMSSCFITLFQRKTKVMFISSNSIWYLRIAKKII